MLKVCSALRPPCTRHSVPVMITVLPYLATLPLLVSLSLVPGQAVSAAAAAGDVSSNQLQLLAAPPPQVHYWPGQTPYRGALVAPTVRARQGRAIFGGASTQIAPQPCSGSRRDDGRAGGSGVCMFVWECVKLGGVPVGICTDRFMFGGCCQLADRPAINRPAISRPIDSAAAPHTVITSVRVTAAPSDAAASDGGVSGGDGGGDGGGMWTSLLHSTSAAPSSPAAASAVPSAAATSVASSPPAAAATLSLFPVATQRPVSSSWPSRKPVGVNSFQRPIASTGVVGGLFGGSGVWSAAHHPTSTRKPYPRPEVILDLELKEDVKNGSDSVIKWPIFTDSKRPPVVWIRPSRPTRHPVTVLVETVNATYASSTTRRTTLNTFQDTTAVSHTESTTDAGESDLSSTSVSSDPVASDPVNVSDSVTLPSNTTTTTIVWTRPTRPTRPSRPPSPPAGSFSTSLPLATSTAADSSSPSVTTTTATTTAVLSDHFSSGQLSSSPPTVSTAGSTVSATTTASTEPSTGVDQLAQSPAPTTASVASSECGVPPLFPDSRDRPSTRIVGGKNAPFGGFPWQVSVRRTSFFGLSTTHRCGGALLNEQWVATAGHCVDDLLLSQIRIRVGEYDFGSILEPFPYQERGAVAKVVHPSYNFYSFEYDLALVRLESPLQLTPNVHPICLPASGDLMVGENATVTGWGRLSEGGTLPSILQQATVPIMENDKCKQLFLKAGRHEYIPDIFLCAGYETGGTDSCQGDSGGPLQVRGADGRWFLAGIISWGIGCAEPNLPGVCTRISKFTDWIIEQVAGR